MNFDKLRRRIVEQAIRGQLVPQVRGEYFISKGPYEIPQTWRWVRLAEIATNVEYGTSVKCHDLLGEQDIPVIRMGNIQNGKLNFQKLKFAPRNSVDLPKLILEDGDIVFNRTNSRELVGKCAVFWGGGKEFSFASYIIVQEFMNQEPVYISEYINSDLCRSTQILPFVTQQVGQANFNGTKLKNILIPLPPLEEQARIVAKLDDAFAEIDRAEKAYEELQALAGVLRGQILQEAIQGKLVQQLESEKPVEQIGDAPEDVPFAIPEKWKWATLNDVGKWKAGGTPSRSVNEYYENGTIPWLKTGDLNDGKINSVEEFITQKGSKIVLHISILLELFLSAMYGATIGKLGVLEMKCATNQACCACVVKDDLIDNWYLFYYLLSQRNKFIALGAGGAQPNISRTKIIHYPIPLPPLEEQKRIVLKVEELLKQVDALSGR